MALPYPIPDPATGVWDPFALKQNLHYLDRKVPPQRTSPPGVFSNSNWAGGATGANTDETVGGTFSLPANTINATGDTLWMLARFFTAANGNTKRYRVYFGSTVVADTGAVAMNGQSGEIECLISRSNVTSPQYARSSIIWSPTGTSGAPTRIDTLTQATEDLSSVLTVTFTMQNGSASADDCHFSGPVALFYPGRTLA